MSKDALQVRPTRDDRTIAALRDALSSSVAGLELLCELVDTPDHHRDDCPGDCDACTIAAVINGMHKSAMTALCGGIVRALRDAGTLTPRPTPESHMNARTKSALPSSFRPGYEHPAGTEVTLVEPLDPDQGVWLVEIRVPDGGFEGEAWYEHVELRLADLTQTAGLTEEDRMAIAALRAWGGNESCAVEWVCAAAERLDRVVRGVK